MEVVDGDDLVLLDEPPREGRADEPGAAGDEDPLAASATRDRSGGPTPIAGAPDGAT